MRKREWLIRALVSQKKAGDLLDLLDLLMVYAIGLIVPCLYRSYSRVVRFSGDLESQKLEW
jgi:hypothetical protein